MAEAKKRVWWCQCMPDLINYHKNIDRAKGILSWSEDKGYKTVTSGAVGAMADSLKNLQEVLRRCDLWFEGNDEAQRNLAEARSTANTPAEALRLVQRADDLVRMGVSKQCRSEFDLYYEATREQRERELRELREARRR